MKNWRRRQTQSPVCQFVQMRGETCIPLETTWPQHRPYGRRSFPAETMHHGLGESDVMSGYIWFVLTLIL